MNQPTNPWELWKQGFYAWERATADYLDALLKNEAVLRPSGALLTVFMRSKAATNRATAAWWGALGLPTKRDQERGLHKLNQLESRLLDLEERLEDLDDQLARGADGRGVDVGDPGELNGPDVAAAASNDRLD
jgi:hypothetical protein